MTTTTYAVIPASGYSGDYATVMSTHRTLSAARRAAKATPHMHYVVIERTGARTGDRVHRLDARTV